MAIRVALAEDNYLVREGLETLLGRSEGVEIVASCPDMTGLLEAVERNRPEVVITDIRMPPAEADAGLQISSRLHDTHPEIGVVVLSQYLEPGFALRLFQDGSAGRAYLLKERLVDRAELVGAVESVAAGGSVIDPAVVEALVQAQIRAEDTSLSEMTSREIEVLAAVAEGKSNAAIASDLVLTKRAVEKHLNRIFLKLDLTYSPESSQISKRVKAALIFLDQSGT